MVSERSRSCSLYTLKLFSGKLLPVSFLIYRQVSIYLFLRWAQVTYKFNHRRKNVVFVPLSLSLSLTQKPTCFTTCYWTSERLFSFSFTCFAVFFPLKRLCKENDTFHGTFLFGVGTNVPKLNFDMIRIVTISSLSLAVNALLCIDHL